MTRHFQLPLLLELYAVVTLEHADLELVSTVMSRLSDDFAIYWKTVILILGNCQQP